MNNKEREILIDQLDKVIDGILEIEEDTSKDSKMIFPLIRLMKLKKGIKEGADNE